MLNEIAFEYEADIGLFLSIEMANGILYSITIYNEYAQ